MTDLSIDLAAEVVAELSDERFVGLIHGQNGAYDKGCRGVLCRKFNRDKVRATYARRHPEARRARSPRNPQLDDLLTAIIADHARTIMQERANRTHRDILAGAS